LCFGLLSSFDIRNSSFPAFASRPEILEVRRSRVFEH
jgi:hypothetical protein